MPRDNATPRRRTPSKQREGRAPVVDNPAQPRMGEKIIRPRRIGRKVVRMPNEPTNEVTGNNIMKPVPGRRSTARPKSVGDQVPIAVSEEAVAEDTGYVRLRVRLQDGELELRGAKFVEGPLQRDEPVSAGLTYEAKVGRRRIAHGDMPDAAEWRSHPDPEGRRGLEGHHVTEQRRSDFNVRIPAGEVDEKTIEDLTVTVYRWRGEGPGEHIGINELPSAPKVAVEKVASLKGLGLSDLPKGLARDLRNAVGRAAG